MRRLAASCGTLTGAWLAIVVLVVLGCPPRLGAALAQTASEASRASQPAPAAQPRVPAGETPPEQASICPDRPTAGITEAAENLVVALDPQTLWRPRGAAVNFSIKGRDGGTIQVQRVQVCMGWSIAPPQTPPVAHDRRVSHVLLPTSGLRSLDTTQGGAVFSAVVPDLEQVPLAWPRHLASGNDVEFVALSIVPVADMVVRVTLAKPASGPGSEAGAPPPSVLVALPVGITSVSYAVVLVLVCVALFFLAAWAFVPPTGLRKKTILLTLISTQDGYASLSQFQIVLWTITVGASAVYVMTLSGNLIDLSSGTLVLLGIAGGSALLARIPSRSPADDQERVVQPAPVVAPAPVVPALVADPAPVVVPASVPHQAPVVERGIASRRPRWSDLVVANRTIDVTRVQMLTFTLISAAFVVLKVLVTYVIPVIPDNFLLLMGISNGIYVAGRSLPTQSDAARKGV